MDQLSASGDDTSKTHLEPSPIASNPDIPDIPRRDWRFWLIFLSITVSYFNTALELCAVSTALPTIINELHGTQFIWVGSAYALSATAFVPLSGGLAQIFGRKPVILSALLLFAAGSAICGAATSLGFLITGRTIQGIGGGSIASLVQILLSDLVPLQERGMFNGLFGVAWSIASGIGPVVGGALAEHGQWRWIFYMNIPFSMFAFTLVFAFLNLRSPSLSLRDKVRRVDWVGTFLVVASTTSCVIALTWGGVQYPWTSATVLVPLLLGLSGLFSFFVYESYVPNHPMVPYSLMSTATGISGFLQTFIMPIILLNVVYYMPVYFQACKGASPITSGIDGFGIAFSVAPAGIAAGVSVNISQRYRGQLWIAWMLVMVGAGALTMLQVDSSRATAIGFQIILGVGLGILSSLTYFPVLAPLHVSSNAAALAFFTFLRNFAQVWGITIGGTVLQNGLRKRLPASFTSSFPQGVEIAYSVIPLVKSLEEPLRSQVRLAFADSIRVIWQVMIGIGGIGLLLSFFMKALPLHTSTDKNWGYADGHPGAPLANSHELNATQKVEEASV